MSTLYIKVAIARHPISDHPRAIRVIAGFDSRVNTNNAVCYSELGFRQFSEFELNAVIARFKREAGAGYIELDIKKEVAKYLA